MSDPTKHVLLTEGPDRTGLIYHVMGVLFRHGLNVIHNNEYVSPVGHFFMRTEFAGSADTALDADTLLNELHTALPDSGIAFRLSQ